ncbi:MAG: alpha/beta fold hydrolase [Planctomycetota bacterium]
MFVCPQASSDKYQEATDRLTNKAKAENDTELLHYAMARTYDGNRRMDSHEIFHADKNVPVPEGEAEALDRKEFTIHFVDVQDSLLAELHPIRPRSLGDCLIPDFKVVQEPKVDVPVLVCAGQRSIVTSQGDYQAVADHYGGALVSFDKSGDYPFVDEPERFSAVVMKFLTKYLPKTKEAKDAKKK